MPREVIKGVNGMFDVHVGWSDGAVQLGVETAEGKSLAETFHGEDLDYTGIWATLDENTIDKLVRLLNKARYRAYKD